MAENGTANCLVLHDWPGELDAMRWFDLASQFFSEVGEKPISGEVLLSNSSVRRPRPKALERRIRAGERFDWAALHGRPVDPKYPYLMSHVSAGYAVHGRKRTLYFIYDARGLPLEHGLFADLVLRLSAFLHPRYGYGFRRPFSRGPQFFALGTPYGEGAIYDEEEHARMTRWHHERLDMTGRGQLAPFRHLEGMLRDVFPFNILTVPHLTHRMAGVALRDWIQADAARGRLVEITNDLWSWVVPGKAVTEVRRQLQGAGLLIDRPKDG